MRRKTARSTEPSLVLPEDQPLQVIIADDGDIFLEINDLRTRVDHRYRCSRSVLSSKSEYFNVLFDPVKFSEGRATEAKLQELTRQYPDPASIPFSKVPSVVVSDVGELPKACVSTSTVVRLFLMILHDPTTSWPVPKSQSIEFVALLAIIADRLASVKAIKEYLRGQKLDTILLKERKSAGAYLLELDNRQRLLAGFIFGFGTWVRQCSAALIIDGPKRQMTTILEASGDEEQENDASWWRLPNDIEEELACRREYVLDTLSSVQKHFTNLYIKKPQCRLGYGSSLACDSFQLGEMIKFLSRKGTMTMESTFDPTPEELEPYNGNLSDIVTRLRECTSYQIDENHTHCGLRTRLIPILNSLELGQAAICLSCWEEDRVKESWLESPEGGRWVFNKQSLTKGCEEHRKAKALYTADRRDWTPPYTG